MASAKTGPATVGGRVTPSGPQSAKRGTNNVQGGGGGTSGPIPASAKRDQKAAIGTGKFPRHQGGRG